MNEQEKITADEKRYLNELKEYFSSAENIFDVMVGAYSVIPIDAPANWGNAFSKEDELLRDCFRRYIDAINAKDSFLGNPLIKQKKALETLKKDLENCRGALEKSLLTTESGCVLEFCYRVIRYIDDICQGKDLYKNIMHEQYSKFVSLNKSTIEKYKVLPTNDKDSLIAQFSGMHDEEEERYDILRKRFAASSPSMMYGKLENYIILPASTNIEIHNPKISEVISDDINNKGKLRIGLFPITNKAIKELFHLPDTQKGRFSIGKLKNNKIAEHFLSCYRNAYSICQKYKVDFAIFPEIFAPPELHEKIIEIVTGKEGNNINLNKTPYLIWLGSSWENNTNKCRVIDRNGITIYEYHKKMPFIYGEPPSEETENLSLKDKTIHVIDVEGVGRFMTGICKDITNDDFRSISKKVFASFLMLPSYTPSLDLDGCAEELSKEWIIVCCSNACACSAIGKKEDNRITSFISIPAKYGTGRDSRVEYWGCSASNMDCESICEGFIMEIDFTKTQWYQKQHVSPFIKRVT